MRIKQLSLLILLGFWSNAVVWAVSEDPQPKLIVVGQVSRADSLTKSLELKSQDEANSQPDVFGGITIGGTIGKRAPGSTGPNSPSLEGPGRTFPQNAPVRRSNVITVVFLTDTTVCKERTKVFLCGELKMKDRLQVTGDEKSGPRGRGIYATEIVRFR